MSATGHLADTLAMRFGSEEVFRDIQTIDAGDDFREALNAAVRSAQVMLVVIGRSWSRRRGATSGSKQLEREDYVRLEIEAALERDIPVVPVLVEGATMPAPEDLPESLRPIAYRHALEISDLRWRYDTERLIQHLAQHGLVPRTQATASAWSGHAHALMSAFMQLPADFLSLFFEPRRLLTLRASGRVEDLVRACVFLVVTEVLGGILVLQVWPTRSGVFDFLSTGPILALLAAFVISLPMYWAWRLAGAGREYRRVLAIVLYQCSFVGMYVSLATLVTFVGIEIAAPQALDGLARDTTAAGAAALLAMLQANPSVYLVVAALLVGLLGLGTLLWLARTWGAYRLVLAQPRRRSFAALAIFVAFIGAPAGFLIWAALLVS